MNSFDFIILATIIIIGLMFISITIWFISSLWKHFVRSKQMTKISNNPNSEQQHHQTSNEESYCNNLHLRRLSLKNVMGKSIHQLNNQIDDHYSLYGGLDQPFQIPRPKLIKLSIRSTSTATPDYDMTDDDGNNNNHIMERPYSYIFPNNYPSNNNEYHNNNKQQSISSRF